MNNVQEASDHFDPKIEPMRRMEMIEVHVECPDNNSLQLGSCIVRRGTSSLRCYEDQLPLLESMVERDTDALERAERQYRLNIAREVMDRVSGFSGKAQDMVEAIDAGEIDTIIEAHEQVIASTQRSIAGEFHATMGRDILPLRSVKVAKRGIVEPQAAHAEDLMTRQLAVFQSATGSQMADAQTQALTDMLTEQNAKLTEQNAKLAKRLDALEKQKEG